MTSHDDSIEPIRARHNARISGPHRWFINVRTQSAHLSTIDRGRIVVLGFSSRGFNGAQPVFRFFRNLRKKHDSLDWVVLTPVGQLPRMEVNHNGDVIVPLPNADAVAIEKSWEDVETLLQAVDALRDDKERLREQLMHSLTLAAVHGGMQHRTRR